MASSTATVQGHGGAFAHGGGGGAQCVAGEVPEGEQGGGADAALGDEVGEGVEVVLLLRLHVAEDVAAGASAQDVDLALVDAFGAIFAGVVDADHALDALARGGVARKAGGRRRAGAGAGAHRNLRPLVRLSHVASQARTARA